MSRLRDALRLIGRPTAVSWPAFWASLLAGVIGGFATNRAGIDLGVRLLILLSGQAALWIVLLGCRAILMRQPDRTRPGLVLAAFTVGVGVRITVAALIAGWLVGPEQQRWLARALGAVTNQWLTLVVVAFVVGALRERRAQIASLVQTQDTLRAVLAEVEQTTTEHKEAAVARVQEVLAGELMRLETSDASASLAALQRTAADVVRPLSHELALNPPDAARPPRPLRADVRWGDAIDVAVVGRPFRPALSAAVAAVVCLGGIVTLPGQWQAITLFPFVLLVALAAANQVLERVLAGWPRRRRIAVVGVVTFVIGLAMAAFVLATVGTHSPGPAFAVAALFVTMLSLGVSVVTATIEDGGRVVAEERAAARRLRRLVVRQYQAQWYQSKTLARALHGPVQNAVTAGAIRIDAAIRAGDVPESVIADVRSDLMAAVDLLGESVDGAVEFDKGLARLEATWRHICTLSLTISSGARAAIEADVLVRSCLLDIVIESVSNAVRHAGATCVDISLRLDVEADGYADIVLDVRSDGTPVQAAESSGLGTRMLDECVLDWTRVGVDGEQILHARVPLADEAG